MRGPAVHVLQDVLAPMPGRPEALYLAAGGFGLAAGKTLSSDSYFNSFYLGPWRAHAQIGRLGVRLQLDGSALLRVIGIDGAGARHVLFADAADHPIWIDALGLADLAGRPDLRRLFLEVEAQTDCRIASLAYVTDTPPANTIRLSIGICTFNREAYLAETLSALAEARRDTPEIRTIRVVNQGPGFTDPALAAQLENAGAELIEQANLGGCGGFARTMYEAAIADDDATHHLLMDDDIQIDARVIARAIRFAAHARHDLTIGGQMLDIMDPGTVYEAGGIMDAGWLGKGFGKDADLTDPASLSLFDAPVAIHYNCWWWCMMPTALIRDIGLPAPYFIRGDDVEYGCRATAAGVPTVPLPGVCVWHESFGYKLGDWLTYYDVRNRLANAALYPQFAARLDLLYLLGVFFNYMLLHRYAAAQIIAMAVRDYLAGPEALAGEDSEARHHRLLADIARMPKPELVTRVDPADYDAAPSKVSFLHYGIGETVWGFTVAFLRISLGLRRRRPILFEIGPNHPALVGGRGYAMPLDIEHERYAVFTPSRLALWGNTARVAWSMLVYLMRRRAAAQRWRAGFGALSETRAWEQRFAIPRGRDLS